MTITSVWKLMDWWKWWNWLEMVVIKMNINICYWFWNKKRQKIKDFVRSNTRSWSWIDFLSKPATGSKYAEFKQFKFQILPILNMVLLNGKMIKRKENVWLDNRSEFEISFLKSYSASNFLVIALTHIGLQPFNVKPYRIVSLRHVATKIPFNLREQIKMKYTWH